MTTIRASNCIYYFHSDKLAPSCEQAGQGPLDQMVHYHPTKGEGKDRKGRHSTRSCAKS
jgi:hypothetical protein